MSQTAKRLKQTLGAPIIFGGIHTTLNTKSVMTDNPWIDFANVGEGDDSLLDEEVPFLKSAPLAPGEQEAYQATIPTEDRTEALRAFAEKRPPRFQGR
jgi:hypothetical protein